MGAAHIALEASIYRLSNVGLHFINCVVDPQNSCPNWYLCRDIESSIETELLVLVAGLCRSMQSFVATCSLSSFLNSITTDFDNVVTKFWCSSFVLVATRMYCVATPNLFASSFSCPSAFRVCHDIIFLMRQTFTFSACQLCHDRVSLSA